MENFIYAIIFIIGTFFGSFFTLAVYRIPKKEDILIKHSYCPNCNHKLGFFDLFPVLSYILLGGKCRYCNNKIRARYLILELLSGITFLILAISMKVNFFNINNIIDLAFFLVYVSVLFIIAGIDKENVKVEKNVLLAGFIIEILYMIYLYTVNKFNVYQYVIYLILFIIILAITKMIKNIRNGYILQVLYLSLYMIIFCSIEKYLITLMLSIVICLFYNKFTNIKKNNIPIGLYLSISNIIVISVSNIIVNYNI